MRQLILILVLAVCSQPLQAGFCAVDTDQSWAYDTEIPLGMDHPDGHDCCQGDGSGTDDVCESGPHCGSCSMGPPAISAVSKFLIAWQSAGSFGGVDSLLPHSHSSPPFRPPIA
jgi:hypothetical protein